MAAQHRPATDPETAFFVGRGDEFELRWFTPRAEALLCGHATLATAYTARYAWETRISIGHIASASGTAAQATLIRRDPGDVSIWRQAACGIIWTCAVFIIPAIWWKLIDFVDLAYPDANVSSPPIPRPPVVWYGLMCTLFSVANWLVLRLRYRKGWSVSRI
jgi:hypothetical protein